MSVSVDIEKKAFLEESVYRNLAEGYINNVCGKVIIIKSAIEGEMDRLREEIRRVKPQLEVIINEDLEFYDDEKSYFIDLSYFRESSVGITKEVKKTSEVSKIREEVKPEDLSRARYFQYYKGIEDDERSGKRKLKLFT